MIVPNGHFIASLFKSAIRIVGCIILIEAAEYTVQLAGIAFLLAEAVGILEEMV